MVASTLALMSTPAKQPQPQMLEQVEAAIEYAARLLEERGVLELLDGRLCAGGDSLYNDTALVDAVKRELGFGCTIFEGNVRVATTATAAGESERAIGTSANEQITQQVLRRGERFKGITRTLNKDWVIIYEPLRAGSGRIIGMLAAYRELIDFVGELELLADLPEGVLLHELDGLVLDANRAAADMLGLARAELLTARVADFTTEHYDLDRETAQLSSTGGCARLERAWRRADGFCFAVELTVSPVEWRGARRLLTISRDFSEQLAAREKLRALNEQLVQANARLEDTVAQRTQELVAARDAAMQANRAKSAFLANMSHELRTPLNAVMGYSEMLMEDAIESSRFAEARDLDRIRSSSVHLLGLINGILDLAKVESGKTTLHYERVTLDELLQPVLDTIEPLTAKNNNTFRVERLVDEQAIEIEIEIDVQKLQQILLNLLSNALKFTRAGVVTLRVRVSSSEQLGLCFTVEDTGVGIAPARVRRVFDAFTQADESTTREFGGTGLGLTITRRFVELMGGEVTCESQLGVGTSFRVRLPLVRAIS